MVLKILAETLADRVAELAGVIVLSFALSLQCWGGVYRSDLHHSLG